MLKYLKFEINYDITYRFDNNIKNLLSSINKIRYEIFNSKNEINNFDAKYFDVKFNCLKFEKDKYQLYLNRILKECKLTKQNKKELRELIKENINHEIINSEIDKNKFENLEEEINYVYNILNEKIKYKANYYDTQMKLNELESKYSILRNEINYYDNFCCIICVMIVLFIIHYSISNFLKN